MKWKRSISLFTALCLLIGCIFSTGLSVGAAGDAFVLTPDNVPVKEYNAKLANGRQMLLDLEKDLPSALDLRNYNGMNYVTPVKQQAPFGSCWAFAMAAAAEISYLYENDMGVPAGEVNDQVDFSEKYIAWYMHHALTQEDVQAGGIPASQVGEGYDLSVPEANDRNFAYDIAGNPRYGVNFFASGFGPVDEHLSIDGDHPYLYVGKNRWLSREPDEANEELAVLRKQRIYHVMKADIQTLINYGFLKSEEEFDAWFEENWKGELELYQTSLEKPGYSDADDWTLPLTAAYRSPEIEAFFKSSYMLPSPCTTENGDYLFDRAGVAAIKSELSNGRGVSIGILADDNKSERDGNDRGSMNTTTWSQYYTGSKRMNHLVTVVGYDDHYPKEKFTRTVRGVTVEGSTPPEDGAFIVKNSWGALTDEDRRTAEQNELGDTVYKDPNAAAWGINDTGYFYLSYYDQSIHTPISFSFYNNDETRFTEINYDQYDLMQDVDYRELLLGDACSANIFTAEEDEYLYQISSMICTPMTTVRYQIYKDVTDAPDSGELIESGEVFKEYAGYQRIDLDGVAYLPKGTRYAVVITQESTDENRQPYTPVTVSLCENNHSKQGGKIRSVINPGESFIRTDGRWIDLESIKKDVERAIFNKDNIRYSQAAIDKLYLNGTDDYQVDNNPIKAFLIPARTVTERLVGDADLDGSVTILDATAIQRSLCSLLSLSHDASYAADADSDGEITVLDATWIQRSLVELDAPAAIGSAVLVAK